jgi:dehydrodolichyl diphosphate syntase complex subunit NUS1
VTGILKRYMPQTHTQISHILESYFGPERKPTLSLRGPNMPSYSPPNTPPSVESDQDPHIAPFHLTVLLISADDGRATIVDLTKTLAEMAQRQKLAVSDVTTDLIDAELRDSVMKEPDLLVLFGPKVELKGYPPWQVRLTEIL